MVILLIINSTITYGQQNDYIAGQLVDSKDKFPIPFATIRVKNKSVGLISNMDGGFKIPVRLEKLGNTLVISSIGYISKEIVLSTLNQSTINIIQLSAKVEALDEIVLVTSKKNVKLNALEIVSKAIKQIPFNYPYDPFSYVGYYRDYQVKEDEYVNLNEALMRVYDPGFGFEDKIHTRVSLLKSKQNTDFLIDTVATRPYDYSKRKKFIPNATLDSQGGNEYTILRLHDAIRNNNIRTFDFVNNFNRDLIKNHRFKLLQETSIDDTQLYVIEITEIQGDYSVLGKIYISKAGFKIYKMEYAVYDQTAAADTSKKSTFNTRQRRQTKPTNLLYEIIVAYKEDGLKMYPNYISFNNSFKILQPPKFKATAAVANLDKERFELTLNNIPDAESTFKKRKYKIWYQGKRMRIDSIAIENKTILLFPKNRDLLFGLGVARSSVVTKKDKERIDIKNVKDIYGNVINQQKTETYYQYREFFVQALLDETSPVMETRFMSKTKPIFQNQPNAIAEDFSDYWMNTPLKN